MKTEIKFTSDGKKVAVVGKLNSQETIVQEIFVVGEAEIPSGENFVVKSLHDAPAISWKEKSLKELEERFDKEYKSWDERIRAQEIKLRNTSKELEKKITWAASALKNVDEGSFELLVAFAANKICWAIKTGWRPELITFSGLLRKDNGCHDTELRLLSLFGRDDGTLQYKIGEYSDWSGGSSDFLAFTNYEEALAKYTELILTQPLNSYTISDAKKHGIDIPIEKLNEYKETEIKRLEKDLEYRKNEYQKIENEMQNINQLS